MFWRRFSTSVPNKSSRHPLKTLAYIALGSAAAYVGILRFVVGHDYQKFGTSIVSEYSTLRNQAYDIGMGSIQKNTELMDEIIATLFKHHAGTLASVTVVTQEEKYQESTDMIVKYHFFPTVCQTELDQSPNNQTVLKFEQCKVPWFFRHTELHFYFPIAIQVQRPETAVGLETQLLGLFVKLEHMSDSPWSSLHDENPFRVTEVSICDAWMPLNRFRYSKYFRINLGGYAKFANYFLISPTGKPIVIDKAITPNGKYMAVEGIYTREVQQKL